MKNKYYDQIFLTNLPAFYKLNLFNEIAKHKKILVLFTGDTSDIRTIDFFKGKYNFDSLNFKSEDFNILSRIRLIIKIRRKYSYKELVLGGWDSIYLWFMCFISPKHFNSLMVESSYLESNSYGVKGLAKRFFLKKIKKVYASGTSQQKLVRKLGYNGEVIITKGVGVFNIVEQPKYESKTIVKNFIYVGRLSKEKNLLNLVYLFNKKKELTLNIIGYGPMDQELRSFAKENINFLGSVNNKELPDIYRKNDVFILPSSSEPWGLVVEEAFNNGLPVIVSNKVGCAEEIVDDMKNGLIFQLEDENSLELAIDKICNTDLYNQMRKNISKYNFNDIKQMQVNCYLQ
ncbi:MAG: glycosyltransferase family 4 protein [Tissierellia bacterium]|nr:glycosyltransferase family 4 protein [Tissierellia bacterium]